MELDGLGVLLGVKSPWFLKKVDVQHHTQVIDVYIEYHCCPIKKEAKLMAS
jgi:hypothetical protein